MGLSIGSYYYLQDDVAPGPFSPGTGAQLSADFAAPTLAAAQTVAQQFAILFQRTVRLVPKVGSGGPYTAYVPNQTSLMLSNAPSGIAW
jgi:hypothetical protein